MQVVAFTALAPLTSRVRQTLASSICGSPQTRPNVPLRARFLDVRASGGPPGFGSLDNTSGEASSDTDKLKPGDVNEGSSASTDARSVQERMDEVLSVKPAIPEPAPERIEEVLGPSSEVSKEVRERMNEVLGAASTDDYGVKNPASSSLNSFVEAATGLGYLPNDSVVFRESAIVAESAAVAESVDAPAERTSAIATTMSTATETATATATATASATAATTPPTTPTATALLPKPEDEADVKGVPFPYACPRCGEPIEPLAQYECPSCDLKLNVRDGYVDLSPPESTRSTFIDLRPSLPRETMFRNPLVAFAYERGWRDNFKNAGFPGRDEEYKLLEKFFFDGDDDGKAQSTIVDLSCGSGLMARKMAASGSFKKVIASDLSKAMLRETVTRANADGVSFDVVRANVSKLPFQDNALEYAHAGAALHCWVQLQDSLAEVHRILKPGGKFFATTFLTGAYFPGQERRTSERLPPILQALRDSQRGTNAFRFFEKDELKWLLRVAGFEVVDVETRRGCAILRCIKSKKAG